MIRKQSSDQSVDWQSVRQVLQATADVLDEGERSPALREAILTRRAELAALSAAQQKTSEHHLTILQLTLGAERYAIPVQFIRRIAELARLTPVPCVPAFYRGVTNLRGKIVSILDLRIFFGIAIPDPKPQGMVVVVAGAGLEIALLADHVTNVMDLPSDSWLSGQAAGYDATEGIAGLTGDGLILLDIETLLQDPRLRIYEEIAL